MIKEFKNNKLDCLAEGKSCCSCSGSSSVIIKLMEYYSGSQIRYLQHFWVGLGGGGIHRQTSAGAPQHARVTKRLGVRNKGARTFAVILLCFWILQILVTTVFGNWIKLQPYSNVAVIMSTFAASLKSHSTCLFERLCVYPLEFQYISRQTGCCFACHQKELVCESSSVFEGELNLAIKN